MLPELDEIVKKRKMLGLTQKGLADITGVSQSLITKLEAGRIEPSYNKAKRIFEALNRLELKAEFSAKDLLNEEIVGIQKSEIVSEAVKLMMDLGYSQIPVFDGDRFSEKLQNPLVINATKKR